MQGVVWQLLVVLLVATAVVQAILLIALMRQVGGILVQVRPARVGQVENQGPVVGTEASFESLQPGRPAIMMFVSPTCGICRPLIPAIAAVRKRYQEIDTWAAVIGDDEGEGVRYADEIGDGARLDLAGLRDEWNVPGTPFAVGISKDGLVESAGVVNSLDQLESLAESLLLSLSAEDGDVSPEEESTVHTRGEVPATIGGAM